MNTKRNDRRKGALSRLQAQLSAKVKNTKDGKIELNEKDTKRIKKEIDILKGVIFMLLVSIIMTSCHIYRHDPNVRFYEKGAPRTDLRKTGCPNTRGLSGY